MPRPEDELQTDQARRRAISLDLTAAMRSRTEPVSVESDAGSAEARLERDARAQPHARLAKVEDTHLEPLAH